MLCILIVHSNEWRFSVIHKVGNTGINGFKISPGQQQKVTPMGFDPAISGSKHRHSDKAWKAETFETFLQSWPNYSTQI